MVFGHDTATRWSELEVAECLTASSGVEKLTAQYLHLLKCFCKRKCCLEPVTENMRPTLKIFLFPFTRPCFSGMGRSVGKLFFYFS